MVRLKSTKSSSKEGCTKPFPTFDQAWETCVSGFEDDTLVGLALMTEELNTRAVAWPPPCPSWPMPLTSWLKITLLLSHRV